MQPTKRKLESSVLRTTCTDYSCEDYVVKWHPRSPAFESSSESSFGSGCILRSEELATDVAATAEEAEKADVAAAAEKGDAPFTIELPTPPPPPDARMSAMSDWGKNSAATVGSNGE